MTSPVLSEYQLLQLVGAKKNANNKLSASNVQLFCAVLLSYQRISCRQY